MLILFKKANKIDEVVSDKKEHKKPHKSLIYKDLRVGPQPDSNQRPTDYKQYDLDNPSVNFGIDGGNLGYGVSEKFELENVKHRILIHEPSTIAEDFNFINYPNPISEELKVSISLPYETEAKVILFDINGEVIEELYEGNIRKVLIE